jgi:calcineurin-like phosphoesterase family protein
MLLEIVVFLNKIKLQNIDKVYITADHHFGHFKIIEYTKRPFINIIEMDEFLIKSWNEIIPKDGIVFHLGDISFKPNELQNIIKRLNGKIYFIHGNHDLKIKDLKDVLYLQGKFEILDDLVQLKIGGYEFILCHYPLMSWPGLGRGVLHFHGHTHGTLKYHILAKDVGVDTNNYRPYNLLNLIKEMENNVTKE